MKALGPAVKSECLVCEVLAYQDFFFEKGNEMAVMMLFLNGNQKAKKK